METASLSSSDVEESATSTEEDNLCVKDVQNQAHTLLVSNVKRRRHKPKTSVIPNCVSEWKRKHAEKVNIYYNESYYTTVSDVVIKKGNLTEFTIEQEQYMSTLNSHLHFDATLENNPCQFATHEFYSKHMKPTLDSIRKKIKPSDEENSNDSYIDVMAKVHVYDFLSELSEYLLISEQQYIDGACEVADGIYTQLFYAFATMCHLRPRFGGTAPSFWQGLLGVDVTSNPDFRLCTKSMSYREKEEENNICTVTFVKKKQAVKNKSQKRYIESSCSSSVSSSTEDSSDEEPVHKRQRRCSLGSSDSSSVVECEIFTPEIEEDLDRNVLGRHAGELLLDVRKYAMGNDKMPGIIVNGTKVYFTLLDITSHHMIKLYQRKELDKEKDVATIYYSRPLDILVEEDRILLIENFMRLNNFQFHSKD
ncbi:uncharacterized protein LOC143080678 [Mytilus galloprovincialis]|uniref:uncharacterized protein LOC143080678 n=1 Tax=Mytilus galloprovincialis TaxID=29158 RepID=UPI003F7BC628